MTENTAENTPPAADPVPDDQPTLLADAPKDADEKVATGYAVYDRTLGRYVGPVTKDKPSATEARKTAAKGHTVKVVRV